MLRLPHWIDGKPTEPGNGRWLDVFEPATGHVRWSQTYERNIQAEVRQAMAPYDRLARASGQLASTRLHGSILVEALVL